MFFSLLLISFLQVCVIIVITHFLGAGILNIFTKNAIKPYLYLFLSQVIGITIIVVSTAVIFTQGKTIMLCFIPLFCVALVYEFYWKKKRLEIKRDQKRSYRVFNLQTLVVLGLLLIVSVLMCGILTYQSPGVLNPLHRDNMYYANISRYLVRTHVENITLEYLYPQEVGVQPYHYYDMWLNAFWTMVFGNNYNVSYVLMTTISQWVCIGLGFFALAEQTWTKINLKQIFFVVSTLFLMGFLIDNMRVGFFSNANVVVSQNMWTYPKILPHFYFMTLGILMFQQKKMLYAYLSLLCLPVISITIAIGIFMTLVLLPFFLRFPKKLPYLILTISVAGCIALFYLIFRKTTINVISAEFPFAYLKTLLYYKTIINIVLSRSIILMVLFGVYIIATIKVLSIHKRSFFHPLSISIMLFYLVSLSIAGGLHFIVDSIQMFTNIVYPLIYIVLAMLTYRMYSVLEQHSKKYVFLGVYSVFILWNISNILKYSPSTPIDEAFIQKITKLLPQTNCTIAYILSKEDTKNVFDKNISAIPFTTLNLYHNHLNLLSLSADDLLSPNEYPKGSKEWYTQEYIFSPQEKLMMQNTSFFRFLIKQQKNGDFKTLEQSRIDFILHHKIKYLIISQRVTLPPNLESQIDMTVLSSDKKYTFVRLK